MKTEVGCDIHYIIEKRSDGKWEFLPDKLPAMTHDYNLFSIFGVRDSFGSSVFAPKGIPEDISAHRFNWESDHEDHVSRWNSDELCFVVSGRKPIPHYAEHDFGYNLRVEITPEFYAENKDKQTADRSRWSGFGWMDDGTGRKYTAMDASKCGGIFETRKISECFDTFEEFESFYYRDDWDEDARDYGRWTVNFDCPDYHTASYLTLEELMSADYTRATAHVYKLAKSVYDAFLRDGGKLPSTWMVEESACGDIADCFREAFDPTISLVWNATPEEREEYGISKLIHQLQNIAEQNGITDPKNIRIVFAFDN